MFTGDYKLAILAEYDRCSEPGEKRPLLRREGLYSSPLHSRQAVIAARQQVLDAAYAAHPERFRKPPIAPNYPKPCGSTNPRR